VTGDGGADALVRGTFADLSSNVQDYRIRFFTKEPRASRCSVE
jgi:hypothetical protein